MLRERRGVTRLIAAEVKQEGKRPTAGQRAWLRLFAAVPGAEAYWWQPSDLEEVRKTLQ